jgi:hypothetical protein
MKKGGFVSPLALERMLSEQEKPSWWILDGKVVHCTSKEIEMLKEIKKKTEN